MTIPVLEAHKARLAHALAAITPVRFFGPLDDAYLQALLQQSERSVNVFTPGLGLTTLDFVERSSTVTLEGQLSIELQALNKENAASDGLRTLWLRDVGEQLAVPECVGRLKRLAMEISARGSSQRVLVSGARTPIPAELALLASSVELGRPRGKELAGFVQTVLEGEGSASAEDAIAVTGLLRGLDAPTILRVIRDAVREVQRSGSTVQEEARKQRDAILRSSSVVEVVASDVTQKQIGGLKRLMHWLEDRAEVFNDLDGAERDGVQPTRGVLLVGMPGCGKSLAAKVSAAILQVPLLRLDVGRLMGKYLGDSEGNLRAALAAAEAAAPCVLWIDELEKALSGFGGDEGGGTSSRMLGSLLTWMQEGTRGVFLVATANAIDRLPPELLRRGRFDEFFFVDLPDKVERREIIEAQLAKQWKLHDTEPTRIANETEGYSGADLATLLKMAVEEAWLSSASPPHLDRKHIEAAMKGFTPLGSQWKEKLENARKELDARGFRNASIKEGDPPPEKRSSRAAAQLHKRLRDLLEGKSEETLRFFVGKTVFHLRFLERQSERVAVVSAPEQSEHDFRTFRVIHSRSNRQELQLLADGAPSGSRVGGSVAHIASRGILCVTETERQDVELKWLDQMGTLIERTTTFLVPSPFRDPPTGKLIAKFGDYKLEVNWQDLVGQAYRGHATLYRGTRFLGKSDVTSDGLAIRVQPQSSGLAAAMISGGLKIPQLIVITRLSTTSDAGSIVLTFLRSGTRDTYHFPGSATLTGVWPSPT